MTQQAFIWSLQFRNYFFKQLLVSFAVAPIQPGGGESSDANVVLHLPLSVSRLLMCH